LDVLLEDNHYTATVDRNIETALLLTTPPHRQVTIPNANCILADKLTAFAPHTTGVPFGVDKELEIIKQLYDIASLVEHVDNLDEVKSTYGSIVASEIEYRDLPVKAEDVLRDTINSAACIAGRGIFEKEEYPIFQKGISRIRDHIIGEKFSGEIAVRRACMVMFIAAAILSDASIPPILLDDEYYKSQSVPAGTYQKLSYIRKTDLTAYKYLIETLKMLS
jgi:hypothetical protein